MTTGAPGVRVGLDLVQIATVAQAITQFGSRYLRRLFTPHEIECCPGEPLAAANGLAARLAAKEATMKVLRPGDRPERPDYATPPWTSIEVIRHPGGWCSLSLTGPAAALKDAAGLVDLSLSMSHEAGTAAAVVVGLSWRTPEPEGKG